MSKAVWRGFPDDEALRPTGPWKSSTPIVFSEVGTGVSNIGNASSGTGFGPGGGQNRKPPFVDKTWTPSKAIVFAGSEPTRRRFEERVQRIEEARHYSTSRTTPEFIDYNTAYKSYIRHQRHFQPLTAGHDWYFLKRFLRTHLEPAKIFNEECQEIIGHLISLYGSNESKFSRLMTLWKLRSDMLASRARDVQYEYHVLGILNRRFFKAIPFSHLKISQARYRGFLKTAICMRWNSEMLLLLAKRFQHDGLFSFLPPDRRNDFLEQLAVFIIAVHYEARMALVVGDHLWECWRFQTFKRYCSKSSQLVTKLYRIHGWHPRSAYLKHCRYQLLLSGHFIETVEELENALHIYQARDDLIGDPRSLAEGRLELIKNFEIKARVYQNLASVLSLELSGEFGRVFKFRCRNYLPKNVYRSTHARLRVISQSKDGLLVMRKRQRRVLAVIKRQPSTLRTRLELAKSKAIPFGRNGFQLKTNISKPLKTSSKDPKDTKTPTAYYSHKLYRGPKNEQVAVHYCTTKEQCERIAQLFLDEKIVGFDMEWNIYAKPSDHVTSFVSCIQVASESQIAVFHLSLCSTKVKPGPVDGFLAPSLKQLIESPDILKTGVNIAGDGRRLSTYLDIKPQGFFELSHYHNILADRRTAAGAITKALYSMDKMALQYLGYPMDKGSVRTSNWARILNLDQISYAATDAYASLHLFYELENRCNEHCKPTPKRSVGIVPQERLGKFKSPSLPKGEGDAEKAVNGDGVGSVKQPSSILDCPTATVEAQSLSPEIMVDEANTAQNNHVEPNENVGEISLTKTAMDNANTEEPLKSQRRAVTSILSKSNVHQTKQKPGEDRPLANLMASLSVTGPENRISRSFRRRMESLVIDTQSSISQPPDHETEDSPGLWDEQQNEHLVRSHSRLSKFFNIGARGAKRDIHTVPQQRSCVLASSLGSSSAAGCESDWESDSGSDADLLDFQLQRPALLAGASLALASHSKAMPSKLLRKISKALRTLEEYEDEDEEDEEENEWDDVEDEEDDEEFEDEDEESDDE